MVPVSPIAFHASEVSPVEWMRVTSGLRMPSLAQRRTASEEEVPKTASTLTPIPNSLATRASSGP